MKKIVIIGSNFAGLDVAKGLKKTMPNLDITIIDRLSYFEYHPAMHKTVAEIRKNEDIRIDLKKLYDKKGIRFVNEEVNMIDADKNMVYTQKHRFSYDYLVIALGASSEYYNIPGAEKYSVPFKEMNNANEIKDILNGLDPKKEFRIAMAGSGLTNIELSFELKRYAKKYGKNIKITIIEACEEICPWTTEKIREYIIACMDAEGIQIKAAFPISKVTKKNIINSKNEAVDYNLLIWSAGLRINNLVEKSRIDSHVHGIMVDDNLRSISHPNIFSCGDSISKKLDDGFVVPKNAHFAMTEAKIVMKNIINTLKSKKLKKYYPEHHAPILIDLGEHGTILMYNKLFFKHPKVLYGFMKLMIEKYWLSTRRS